MLQHAPPFAGHRAREPSAVEVSFRRDREHLRQIGRGGIDETLDVAVITRVALLLPSVNVRLSKADAMAE